MAMYSAAPGDREQTEMARIAEKLLTKVVFGDLARLDEVNKPASELGFKAIVLKYGSESYIVLCGKDLPIAPEERKKRGKRENGNGVYIFRLLESRKGESPAQSMNYAEKGEDKTSDSGDRGTIVIQSPHSRYERYTGYISRLVFEKTKAFALFINTCHRYEKGDNNRYESDVAHNADSYFQVITKVLCDHFSSVVLIQFHGYNTERHKYMNSRISIVLSNGLGYSYEHSDFRRIATRLAEFLGEDTVGIFGEDVYELGATSNVQGIYINNHSDDTFIHIEMSEKFRQELYRNKELRQGFIKVFISAWRDKENR